MWVAHNFSSNALDTKQCSPSVTSQALSVTSASVTKGLAPSDPSAAICLAQHFLSMWRPALYAQHVLSVHKQAISHCNTRLLPLSPTLKSTDCTQNMQKDRNQKKSLILDLVDLFFKSWLLCAVLRKTVVCGWVVQLVIVCIHVLLEVVKCFISITTGSTIWQKYGTIM